MYGLCCNAKCILLFAMYMVVHLYIFKVISICLKTSAKTPITGLFLLEASYIIRLWKWSGISSIHISYTLIRERLCIYLNCFLIAQELGTFRCIPINRNNDKLSLNETQISYVRQTRLHRLADMEDTRIDHALITELVERWSPETNTFHFSTGDATVTLEDVAYIYRLPINGMLVT